MHGAALLSTLVALVGAAPQVGPMPPVGSSTPFHQTAIRLQEASLKGDFTLAQQLARRLPTLEISLKWDETEIPADRRAEFADARDRAIQAWTRAVPELKIRFVTSSPTLKVAFVKELPENPDSVGPAGAVYFDSDASSEPQVEAVLSLLRTQYRYPISPRDVECEILFAIGRTLGLERSPRLGTVMGRVETTYGVVPRIDGRTVALVREIQKVAEALRTAARSKTALTPARSVAALSHDKFEQGTVAQGSITNFRITVTNNGNVDLVYGFTPDCGCFAVGQVAPIKPGQTAVVPITIDTTDTPGPFDKALYFYSNDPERNAFRIPVRFYVEPAFRFLSATGSPILVAEENGLQAEVFLVLSEELQGKIDRVRVVGLSVLTELEPWEGEIADPGLGEPARKRKGYRVRLLGSPEIPPGRAQITLVAEGAELTETVATSFFVQKGIVALPLTAFFGELTSTPTGTTVLLARPNRPFRILSAEVDHPNLSAKIEPGADGSEWRVQLRYDGKAPIGSLSATLKVRTDDPRQPLFEIPVSGTVR